MKYYYYKIENKINGNLYIGITTNLKVRCRTHFCKLRNNHHCNAHLQAAFNKYGEENFVFEQIDELDTTEELAYRHEAELIDKYDTINNGYNITEGRYGFPTNRMFTEEEVYQILAASYFTRDRQCGNMIAQSLGKNRKTINNITRGDNYHQYYEKFQLMSEEEKRDYYEEFCERTDFGTRQYKAHINPYRTRSKEQVWFILWVDKTKKIPWKNVYEILSTTHTGILNIRKGLSYPDYYREFQMLTDTQLKELESHYIEIYNLQIP